MRNTHSFKMNLPEMSDPVDVRELNDNFLVIDDALMAGLCKKELTTNNMGSSDPASRKYGWAPWIEIYNGNEFDVVVIDRNAPDLPSGTINIEAGKTHRMFINGTYYMNFYVQDQHDVTFKWFTDAETRINEIDPSGGGSVSSVNVTGASGSHIVTSGGPITSSGTIEIDLAEGYSIPQTNKQTSWDGKAADLKAEIDSSTYVLTLQLKDSSGNLIGNERTIDLPLETMVVDGEYDPQTQKIKLELKNGNYVEFSVADLVSGLQTELNSNNKLNPAYIDYDASHRAVSDTEKNTWNAKQNAISDLEAIRSGASAGATAVQPSEMETALSTKQDTISDLAAIRSGALAGASAVQPEIMSTALALKQDSLSETQLAAVNSGITSAGVAQISTNQTNILLVKDATEELVDKGAKNIIDIQTPEESLLTSYTSTANGGVALTIKNAAWTSYRVRFSTIINTAYVCKILVDSAPTTNVNVFIQNSSGENYTGGTINSNTTEFIREFTATETALGRLSINLNNEGTPLTNAITVRVMICTKAEYDSSPNYEAYALPNYDLTVREAEDRAALAEQVDECAKNKFDLQLSRLKEINNASNGWTWNNNVATKDVCTCTVNSDGSVCVQTTGSPTSNNIEFVLFSGSVDTIFKESGSYALSGCPTGGSNTTYSIWFCYTDNWTGVFGNADETGSGIINDVPSSNRAAQMRITIRTTAPAIDKVFKPMICTAADWKISQNYAPFALPNTDLTRMVETLLPTSYTAPVVNSDISSKLSILGGGYAKAGNLVTVNIRLSVTDTISAGSALFTGLPEPKTAEALSYGSAVVPVTNMCVNAQVSPNVMSIDTQGTIRLVGTPVSSDITTGIYILSATYLSA